MSTEQLFQDADDAGFLVPASWVPSVAAGSGPPIATKVFYREQDEDYLSGMVAVNFPSMSFPSSWLPGLIENETVTLDMSSLGGSAAAVFTVRKATDRDLDGTRTKAYLKRV
jgi:hypothetical protein